MDEGKYLIQVFGQYLDLPGAGALVAADDVWLATQGAM
jgi:hypothetical protein